MFCLGYSLVIMWESRLRSLGSSPSKNHVNLMASLYKGDGLAGKIVTLATGHYL